MCAQFVYGCVNEQRHCTPEYTFAQLCAFFAQFCAVFAQFCAVAEARGGMRRFYTHLQAASWRQFRAILCNSTLGGSHWWMVEMSPGPDNPDG